MPIPSLADGTVVGRYEIRHLLGSGGMGEVYLARDVALERDIALKILPRELKNDPQRLARFVNEAKAASSLNHRSIVTIHDCGEEDVAGADGTDRVSWIAMELIDGPTLDVWLQSDPPLPAVLGELASIAEALGKAHSQGIIHRDLKPDNIMITGDGHAKVLDFGVAKLMGVEPRDEVRSPSGRRTLTEPATLLGTVGYMSPEQIEGFALDHRADIFSFGCILYESLTGTSPFVGATNAETLHNIVHRDPPPVVLNGRQLTAALQRILERCLAKDRDRRYDSARDLSLDLGEAAGIATSSARRKVSRLRARLSGLRATAGYVGIVLIALLLLNPAGALVTRVTGDAAQPEVERLETLLSTERQQNQIATTALTSREQEISRQKLEIERLKADRDERERLRSDLEASYRKLLADVNVHLRGTSEEGSQLRKRIASAESELQRVREDLTRRTTQQDKLNAIQRSLAPIVEARFEPRGLVLTIPGAYYRSGSSRLGFEAIGIVQNIARQLLDHPEVKVTIEGHTDSSGSDDGNLELSQSRADRLRDALVGGGIDPARFTTVGRGEERPLFSNESEEGQRRNRRVEMILGF